MADSATALVTDGTNLYLAGTFVGIGVNFNATTGTPAITLGSRGSSDAFLLKLDCAARPALGVPVRLSQRRQRHRPGDRRQRQPLPDRLGLGLRRATAPTGWGRSSSTPATASPPRPTPTSSRSTPTAIPCSRRSARRARATRSPPASRPTRAGRVVIAGDLWTPDPLRRHPPPGAGHDGPLRGHSP